MKTCVIPGSFDPFTLGHRDMVVRAARLFDRVYVAIMINTEKKGMLDFATRKAVAEVSCADIPGVTVITAEGVLCDLCTALGADAIVKGARDTSDFAYEKQLADINRRICPGLETVILTARPENECLSSTFARDMIKYGRPLDGIIHPDAIKLL